MAKIQEQLQNNSTPLLVLLLIAAAFFIGRLSSQVEALKTTAGGNTPQPAAQVAGAQPKEAVISMDQIKGLFKEDLIKLGDEKSKVIFVEVSDPSCPFCHVAAGNDVVGNFTTVAKGGSYVPPVQEIEKLVKAGKASFVWIYQNGHGNGELATKALYCANEKGKFWEAHNVMFTDEGYKLINNVVKNEKTKSGELASFLKQAVDEKFMKQCLDSGKYDARLNGDVAIAGKLGVNGTPGFFVNNTKFAGAVSYTSGMENTVNGALK